MEQEIIQIEVKFTFFSRIKYNLPVFIPSKNNIIQFGYIEDLVLAIESSIENSDFYNQFFNISGDEYVTMSEFCRNLWKSYK